MLKTQICSSVLHSCDVKTQMCVTRPQCVNNKDGIINFTIQTLLLIYCACIGQYVKSYVSTFSETTIVRDFWKTNCHCERLFFLYEFLDFPQ